MFLIEFQTIQFSPFTFSNYIAKYFYKMPGMIFHMNISRIHFSNCNNNKKKIASSTCTDHFCMESSSALFANF